MFLYKNSRMLWQNVSGLDLIEERNGLIDSIFYLKNGKDLVFGSFYRDFL